MVRNSIKCEDSALNLKILNLVMSCHRVRIKLLLSPHAVTELTGGWIRYAFVS